MFLNLVLISVKDQGGTVRAVQRSATVSIVCLVRLQKPYLGGIPNHGQVYIHTCAPVLPLLSLPLL